MPKSPYETVRDAVDELAHVPWLESVPRNSRDHEVNRLLVIEFSDEVCAAHGWTVDELDAEANRRVALALSTKDGTNAA